MKGITPGPGAYDPITNSDFPRGDYFIKSRSKSAGKL